jgi:hypothetical protein
MSAPQMLADALLRNLTGTSARLRVTNANAGSSQSELGLVNTAFVDIAVSPVVVRKLQPDWQDNSEPRWELLASATSVAQHVGTLELPSARALFELTLEVAVGEQRFLIQSFTSNEAFGQVYLHRLLLREVRPQAT